MSDKFEIDEKELETVNGGLNIDDDFDLFKYINEPFAVGNIVMGKAFGPYSNIVGKIIAINNDDTANIRVTYNGGSQEILYNVPLSEIEHKRF